MNIFKLFCYLGIHNKKKMPACFDYRCVRCGKGWNYFDHKTEVYPKDEVDNLIMQHLMITMKENNGKITSV